MKNKIYNTIYIGFGPSVIFSLLTHPQENILILEKGKSLKNRDEKEVLYGSGGAGAFSDSKLVANPLVGGNIQDITNISDEKFYELADDILGYYNSFNIRGRLYDIIFKWLPEDNYEIKSEKLKLLKSKVCHIGSDRSKEIFQNIEEYLSEYNEIHFEEEVEDIIPIDGKRDGEKFNFLVITDKSMYYTNNVIVGVGKRSNLVEKLVKQLNLKTKNNRVQIGVRVECPNKFLKELVERFYDFKLVMETKLGRWRTFCVCQKEAYVVPEQSWTEKGDLEFISANGSAVEGNNGFLNFGIMGELDLNLNREEQIKLVQKVNNGTEKLLMQNINDFLLKKASTDLYHDTTLEDHLWRFDNLWKYYPQEICEELREFIRELCKCYRLDGHIIAPEVKLTNSLIEMPKPFEIYPNLFVIGDASGYTRGIIQSGISGMLLGEYLNNPQRAQI
jgi:hypothetical protein